MAATMAVVKKARRISLFMKILSFFRVGSHTRIMLQYDKISLKIKVLSLRMSKKCSPTAFVPAVSAWRKCYIFCFDRKT